MTGFHVLDDLLLDLLGLLVWVTVSGILTVLGDEVQHCQPPVEDAHEPHVVQEDGEPGDILGGPLVDLSLDNRVPLLDLHSLGVQGLGTFLMLIAHQTGEIESSSSYTYVC